MQWFIKDPTEIKEVMFNLPVPRRRSRLFLTISQLMTQAEDYFHDGEIELCNDILNIAIKHIRKNKHTLSNETHRDGGVPTTPTRDTNINLNEE